MSRILLPLLLAVSACAGSLVPNPGFEQRGDDGSPADWQPRGDTAVAAATGLAHTGAACARLGPRRGLAIPMWTCAVKLAPGPYRFAAWRRSLGRAHRPGRGAMGQIVFLNDKGRYCGRAFLPDNTRTRRWQRAEARVRAPWPARRARIELANFAEHGDVLWDDVVLVRDTEAEQQDADMSERNRTLANDAAALLKKARARVKALQQGTDDAATRLHAAALAWSVADAERSIDAGLHAAAHANLTETLARADAKPRPIPRPKPKRPPKPNPYRDALDADIDKLPKRHESYAKGKAGYDSVTQAWAWRAIGDRACCFAYALTDPTSPHFASPDLLGRCLALLEAVFTLHTEGDWVVGRTARYHDTNINRFTLVPALDALHMLEQAFPHAIGATKRREWRDQIAVAVEHQYHEYGLKSIDHGGTTGDYPNMDAYYMLVMELGSRVLGEPRWAAEARRYLRFLSKAVYPNGAFTYHGRQTECNVYHAINVLFLERYHQLTGSRLARRLVERSTPYYPLNTEPPGVPEYYTDCSWKHYWAGLGPCGPEVVACVTGDRLNKRVANMLRERGFRGLSLHTTHAARVWRDFPDAPLPDRYVYYDPDICGPRGRYGRFSFAAPAQPLRKGEIGRDTFVGCMVTNDNKRGLPLDAAVQVVATDVWLDTKPNRWRGARYCSGEEVNAIVMGTDFGALATRYRLTRPAWGLKSQLTDWEGQQEWFLCQDRLVGLIGVRALTEQQAIKVCGRVRLGLRKTIQQTARQTFRYGTLRVKLHHHTYAPDIATQPSETFYIDEPSRYRSTEIVLTDPLSRKTKAKKTTYPAGTRFHFLVEIVAPGAPLADFVQPILDGGIRGLVFEVGGAQTLLFHNPTDQPLSCRLVGPQAPVEARVYRTPNPGDGTRLRLGPRGRTLRLAPGKLLVARLGR